MIVYVESNFVLELAFLQEGYRDCDALLKLAELRRISLALPAFCVGEPYEAWVRKSKRRTTLNEELRKEIKELSRSEPYRESLEELRKLTILLTNSGKEEKRRLDEALDRILNAAEVIPIGLDTLREATALPSGHDFSPQDSIAYASVLRHLREAPDGPKCLVTKDERDFLTPDIEDELNTFDCKLLTTFSNGLNYVRSVLATGP